MIDPKSIERLIDQTDISDIIGHYIPLRKSGGNYTCLCPFHDDKSPSMSVSPSKGMYHCFACKAGGDVIKFVMDYEGLTYPEAIEKIAQLSNFTLNYTKRSDEPPKKEDKHILQKANAYYRSLLFKTPQAINYLRSRGVTDALCEKFELGYAPASIHTIRLLENEQILPKEALEVGIVKQNENGIFASFTERVTFPIHNHTGKLVGFGGRTLGDHPAKYVNSPQSEVFDKSTLFYGYHLAKREIYAKNQIIITEGYLDVIMLHSVGFTNAVAVLGTALTQKHLPILKRGEPSVVLCFDGDSAGINAAVKSSHLLMQNGIDSSVVIISGGGDPADMVVAGKVKELENLFANGVEGGEFYIRNLISKFDLSRPIQKQKALEEVRNFTTSLKPLIANSYTALVANLLKIDPNSFTLSGSNQQKAQNFNEAKPQILAPKTQKDPLEMQILKTLAEGGWLSDMIIDIFKPHIFTHHGEIFEAILRREPEDEALVREILLQNIEAFSTEDEIIRAEKILRRKFYENLRRECLASNDANKLEKLKKIGEILENLNR